MGHQLELYEARLSFIRRTEGRIELHLSYALIHNTVGAPPGRDTGKNWSQEAVMLLNEAQFSTPLPPLPNTITEGYLEYAGVRYELIPLPFEHTGPCQLFLGFHDGTSLELRGSDPVIKLEGSKIFLNEQ